MFGQQEGELAFVKRAPQKRQEIWRKLGVVPRGIDREVVEMMHRTHMGVDQDYREHHACRAPGRALADGWGGSMIATELQDILFGTPVAGRRPRSTWACSRRTEVNIIVHGHEPLLSEMIVAGRPATRRCWSWPRRKGAKGINLAGICCTANEILMRHGIPIAGNFLQQELAIVTGAVDAMVVDVQCVMPVAARAWRNCYPHQAHHHHPQGARSPASVHIEFHEDDALETAKEIVAAAIDNFPNRDRATS